MQTNHKIYDIWLSLAVGTKVNGADILISEFGNAKAVYEADDYSSCEGLNPKVKSVLLNRDLTKATEIYKKCVAKGVGILSWTDPLFPARLKTVERPPYVLYYLGNPVFLGDRCVIAGVGTRKISRRGGELAYAFCRDFAKSNVVVVSGLARGGDAMCHMGALDGGGYTVAFLGTAIDKVYPPENKFLYKKIIKNGVIFSEYYPGMSTYRSDFTFRNRLIAGLSNGVIVCEAGLGSGAIVTANYGRSQGKPVFSIPGPIGVASCDGTNLMLQEGAILARSPSDVLSRFESLFPNSLKMSGGLFDDGGIEMEECALEYIENTVAEQKDKPKYEEKRPKIQKIQRGKNKPEPVGGGIAKEQKLTEAERAVLDAIDPQSGSTADAVALKTGMDISDVLATLTMLELYNAVSSTVGGVYKK